MEVRDMRGVLIQPGQMVAYPDRRGSTVWLNVAEVINVETEFGVKIQVRKTHPQPAKLGSTLTRPDRIVVIG